MKVRFYNDPESGEPHVTHHGVNEQEVMSWRVRSRIARVGKAPGWRWAGAPLGGIFG